MTFNLPTEVNSLTAKGTPKSASTIALYKVHLNKIAKATGHDTVDKLLANSRSVIAAIKTLSAKKPGESPNAHLARTRIYYSAIFYILPPDIKAKPNAFYRANKKVQEAPPANFKETPV